REPLPQLALPEQDQHLFFDQTGSQQQLVSEAKKSRLCNIPAGHLIIFIKFNYCQYAQFMKKPLTFILSLLLCQAAAQEIPPDSLFKDKLLSPYSSYFEVPGGGIYAQFNTSSYMTGEAVWFKI